MKEKNKKDSLFFRFSLILSIIVFLLVVILNRKLITPPTNFPTFIYWLPTLNALINGTCFILLIFSFRAIKQKNIKRHKALNLTTFTLSAIFLISYVVFHFFVDNTTYEGVGLMKIIYYFVLISHIVLAAIVLPLILMSFYYALNQNFDKHKRWVKYSFPIWLYVTLTGVLVYLMISPFYQFPI